MMADKMKFSIIIPVYNVENYLDKCIQSVVSQTYTDFELILIDDGSTDSSGSICEKWLIKDKRIIVIHQKNAGAAAARNIGIKESKGDYIIFLDSDDWWLNNKVLQTIVDSIGERNVDVLSFNFRKSFGEKMAPPYFRQTGTIEYSSFEDIVQNDLWISSPCNKVMASRIFKKFNMFFDEGITSEDIDWCLRLAIVSDTFMYCNVVVFAYRQIESSTSHCTNVNSIFCLYNNIMKCINILDKTQSEKKELLLPYVSYQYGTLLYAVTGLKNYSDIRLLIRTIDSYSYLLKYSKNKKIRMINVVKRIFGLNITVFLLWVMRKFKS